MTTNLSKLISCGHCSNISNMEIIGNVFDTIKVSDPGPVSEYGTAYSILKCPACEKTNIVSYNWNDYMESDDEITYEILYPKNNNDPRGLPDNILSTYKAAEKIKSIDVNAYVILLRRMLELVCLDRSAKGDTLAVMLNDLATKKEIPDKLVKVAKGIKDFGNIGAHAKIGELSDKEIPIVKALSLAILEYIYTAPYLTKIAENKLNAIKGKVKKI
jgi:hypothetical protein